MTTPTGGSSSPPSGFKLWLFRVVLWLGVPCFFFLTLEILLRLVGFGYPTSFLVPTRTGGQEFMVQNDRFGWRFFGPELAREPFPLAIPRVKAPDTVRVFVFGESAAYGDPQPDFGLPRLLEALLSQRYPAHHFEVINAAMTAINSHAVLPIARDCARHNGDIWVVYMGNNEVVGPFGAGTVFGGSTANLWVIRGTLALKATRTGQLLGQLLRKLYPEPASKRGWAGMAMFLGNQLRQDDPRMSHVYAHFKRNLQDILDAGRRVGAQVILCTVASNLKDCAPFGSLHAPGLSAGSATEWNNLYQRALDAEHKGHPTEAVDFLKQAAGRDNSYAELHYLWGQCSLTLGHDSEALTEFGLARDLDTLRFRADSRINQLIREAAAARSNAGVRFVDSEKKLAQLSAHGLTGDNFFYEHVHLNFQGNYALARAIAEEMPRTWPDQPDAGSASERPWASAAECAQRLHWTQRNHYEALTSILGRISDPPFTAQLNHSEQDRTIRAQLDQLSGANSLDALRQQVQGCQAACSNYPGDWVLRKELALAQEKTADFGGAAATWRQVVAVVPHYTEAWQELGRDLAAQKREAEALDALKNALRLNPESVVGITAVAEILSREGKLPEAIQQYQKALRLNPYWGQAHLGLGKAFETLGRTKEADSQFREALQNRIYTPVALNALGRLCFEKGWFSEAVTNFTDALKLAPQDATTHVNLGVALTQLARYSEAKKHFAEAVRLDPNLVEARVRLGFELGREGNDAEAALQFAEAVRLRPTLLEARLDLGIALLKQRRNAESLEAFKEVLRQDPNNTVALKNIQRLSGSSPPPQTARH